MNTVLPTQLVPKYLMREKAEKLYSRLSDILPNTGEFLRLVGAALPLQDDNELRAAWSEFSRVTSSMATIATPARNLSDILVARITESRAKTGIDSSGLSWKASIDPQKVSDAELGVYIYINIFLALKPI